MRDQLLQDLPVDSNPDHIHTEAYFEVGNELGKTMMAPLLGMFKKLGVTCHVEQNG